MRIAAVLVAVFLSTGCHDGRSTILDAPPSVADNNLGVGDTFEVRVYGEADLSASYKVGTDGNITFPLIGVVHVEGLDPPTAAKKIADRLADGILRNPQVSILIKEQTSKKITVLGQVSKPGVYPYLPSMTIVELITQAGGFTPLAAKNDISITRITQGKKETVSVPVASISEGRAKNVYVRPGDIISVPERIF